MIQKYEEKYRVAYKSIMELIITNFENRNNNEDNHEAIKVEQIKLSPEQIYELSLDNQFFNDLYDTINELLTPNGQTLDDFQNLIQVYFPSSLVDYDKMKVTQLKQEIIDGKGKQQELLTQILANAGDKNKEYVDQLLSKFGLDVEGLLFKCD